MKKCAVFVFCFLLTASGLGATHSSVVTLSGGGDIAPNSSFNLSLNGLVPSATYSVVCYIDTTYPFQYILFGTNFTSNTSVILSYSLNGNYVMQDELMVGHNIAVINGKFTAPATDAIVFTNLDQTNSFNINNCFAIPVPV